DDPDIEEGEDDFADVGGIPGIPDEEADTDAADEHFSRNDGEPRKPYSDAQPGEDVRRCGRNHDLPEEFEMIELQHPRDVTVILRNVAYAHGRIDDDGPDCRDEDHENRRGLPIAER